MEFLTEEELYELQHEDELDVLNEIEDVHPFESYIKPPVKKNLRNESDSETKHVVPPDQKSDLSEEARGNSNNLASLGDEEKENSQDLFSDLNVKSSKRSLSETLSDTSNKVNLPVKRKLFECSQDQVAEQDAPSDDELIIDLGDSDSLLPQNEKRKASCLSDEDIVTPKSAKRRCSTTEDAVESFLKGKLQSQARPSLFTETVSMDKLPITQRQSRSSSFKDTYLTDKLPITRSDGRRIYFPVNEEKIEHNDFSFSQKTSSLLSLPIDRLKSQYFIMEEESLKLQGTEVMEVSENQADPESTVLEVTNVDSSLWVEKYHPTCYMHLLSEEGINRTLLHWLKLWDKVVFGKEKKKKKKPVENKKEQFKPTKFQKFGELIEDLDEHGRPYHKVAFLCGAPGLGKTTLATVIARQAGYNIVEINASDDRNPDSFKNALENSTQMNAVLDQDHRPNCLILDEIDGAPAASINVLLSFIKSTGVPKGKRKKGDIPLLMRPIICICNDQYSSALKPLRQLALVLNFPPTLPARLTSRLHEVASKEGLDADVAALTLLCEKTCNDIRSCLSTLQFIHRSKKELRISDIKGMHIGQKDMQKSLFAVWQDVFHYKVNKSFSGIFQTVQAFGDYEKVNVGIFENYLNTKFKHRNIDTVWKGSEWMCFGDIIQQQIAHSQLYFLLPYLPYPAVAFHMLYSSNSFAHISYPSAYYEHKAKGSQLQNTLSSMIKDMVSSLKTFLNPTMLLVDVFPFLLEIIKPNLRPVNTQLYSEREKNELSRVIELMLAFKLTYRQERLMDGTYTYVLDPNIEELIRFSEIKPKKVLTYSTKQMIAREVEMEQMRKGDSGADDKAAKLTKSAINKPSEVKAAPKKQILEDKPMVDFFGRVVVQTASSKKSSENKDPRDEQVWFHFKEGYSNAVRRTVYIKDLL